MCTQAYEILANGGIFVDVCTKLGISEETFCQWAGRGKYQDSPYFKPEFSEYIKKGELAGKSWLNQEIIKAATTKYSGNPTVLIFMTKRRDFIPRLIPELKNGTSLQKLNAITELYSDGLICLDTYEQALTVLERHMGIIDKAKFEEFELRLKDIEVWRKAAANAPIRVSGL